jgi:hypothetical protein
LNTITRGHSNADHHRDKRAGEKLFSEFHTAFLAAVLSLNLSPISFPKAKSAKQSGSTSCDFPQLGGGISLVA